MDLSTILIKIRALKGYSQEAVAEEIHVNYKTYARYEAGKSEMKVSTLQALARFYEITVDQLICYDPKNPYPPNPKIELDKKLASYDIKLRESGSKIMILEERKEYLTSQVETLKDLAETKSKYVKLLEEKVKENASK